MSHYYSFKKRTHLPSLQELCTQVLIDNKHALGDVGDIPSTYLNPVLSHCSPEELQRIEDETMERSGRDIRWDTWQIWERIYISKHGKPNPDEVPELRALSNGSIDLDNLPEGLGDYRALYEQKVEQKRAQTLKLAEKLRNLKREKQKSQEKTKAKRIDSVSLRRPRGRTSGVLGRSTTNGLKNKSGVSAQDFYQKIGIAQKSRTLFKRRHKSHAPLKFNSEGSIGESDFWW